MTEEFGDSAVDKLREPFKATEWTGIRSSAEIPRRSGRVDAPIQDDFDLLSVNHFFNIFDKHWTVLTKESLDTVEAKTTKQAVLGWMKEIKALRDPLAHPASTDFSREDAFRLLDCARRVLARLGFQDESTEVMDLVDQVLGSTDLDEIVLDHRLPSKESVVVEFVGRERELSELRTWFDEPTSALWALAGEGGKGKSAIAYTFAQEIRRQAPVPFQIVMWLSAKKRRFVEGTTTKIESPDFHDLESVLSRILIEFGWAEEAELPVASKTEKVVELLNEFPALLIVDDVDSLDTEGEEAITFFVMRVSMTRSKVLFTSRRTMFGLGACTTHVSGFSLKDARAFIDSRINLMNLDNIAFTQAVVQDVVRVSDGSPLYMEDLLRLSISAKSPNAALQMWQGRKGVQVRRYALERECELLTAAARDVLLAACVAEGTVSFSELVNIVGVDDESVTSGLQELRRLFLVPKPTFVQGEQRFGVNVNTRALVREVYGRTEQWRRIEAAYRAITQGLPSGGRTKIGAIIRQCGLLVRSAKLDEAEKLINSALRERPGDPDLYGFSGWIYKKWTPPRIVDARLGFNRAAELRSIKEEMYEHWTRMERDEREWTRAAAAAEKGLELIPDSGLLRFWAGRSRADLAKELLGGLHHGRAAKEGKAAREHFEGALKTLGDGEKISRDSAYRSLVLLCETMRDLGGLRRFLGRWEQESSGNAVLEFERQRLESKFKTSFGPDGELA
ncbi:MAG: NB-ARC domain-containing protein [Rhodospirillales bacterium]|nr:NB-ARC domain-containing protein [Rhodospirillales bacterium]